MGGHGGIRNWIPIWAMVGCGLLIGGGASAATIGTYSVNPTTDDGLAIPGFYPNIEADLVYTDNVLRVENGKQDSTSMVLAPEVLWVRPAGKHLLRVGYQGEYAWHEALDGENYDDHFLGADANLDLTPKLDVNLLASYRQEHEPRGGGGTVNQEETPNLWNEWIAAAKVVYGRRIAKAQVTALLEHRSRDYTNNDQFLRSHDDNEVVVTLYYNVGAKTHVVIEPSFVQMDYTNPISILDNDVQRLLAGFTWSFAAKTTGEVKLGWVQKDFKDASVPDNSGFGVDATLTWRPKSYSTVTAKITRDIYDSNASNGTTSFEALVASLDWEHKITSLLQLQTGVVYEIDDYDTSNTDVLLGFNAGLSYQLRRDVSIAARYDYAIRESDFADFDFTSHGVVLGVKTSFD